MGIIKDTVEAQWLTQEQLQAGRIDRWYFGCEFLQLRLENLQTVLCFHWVKPT